jgi:hypothetical protein
MIQYQPSKGRSVSGTNRFRFTLGQWQGFVAVLAVCLAAVAFEVRGEYGFVTALSYGASIASMGVLLFNVRLSPWIWVMLAGSVAPRLLFMLTHLASLGIACSLLYVLGLAMMFRDMRRRLEGRENPT